MTDWLSLLKADPLPYLLASTEPAVRWWALRDLLDRPADDPEVVVARLAARNSAPARTILAAQRPSGAWATGRHLYSPKHTATTWQLDILADLGFTASDEPVRRACELTFAWQLDTGGFGLYAGATTAEACATARTLCQLHRFGLGSDPRVQRAWHWLEGTQRSDGGWHCRARAMRLASNSCFLATIKALEACAAAAQTAATGSFRHPEAVWRRAAALIHGCLLSPRVDRFASPTLWDRLVYPNHWYDVASTLDALATLGYTTADESIAAAVDLLAACQLPNGTWRQSGELAFRGGTLYHFGHDGQASPWVTLRAARALKRACAGGRRLGCPA
jgi:hypothetical protein